jgi:hypothetical protein
VTSDASQGQVRDATALLQPVMRWPREMALDRRHTVLVDLSLVTGDGLPAPWPFAGEESAYTCALDGDRDFDLRAVRDAAVVLHRFGGSYGPAEYVVTPRKIGDCSLWLTIINQWGVPLSAHELRVHVELAEERLEDVPPSQASLTPLARLDLLSPSRPDVAFPTTAYGGTAELFADERAAAHAASQSGPPGPGGRRSSGRLDENCSMVALRRSPSGNLRFERVPLFAPGASSGDRAAFTVRCSPAGEHGTAFAVIGELPVKAYPADAARASPQLLSVQSAVVPPGIYQVTAELLSAQPLRIRFGGLPAPPREDPRAWQEIVATVPRRLLPGGSSAHLISAIEVSGPDELVADRINAVRRLVAHVAETGFGPLSYTVTTYGPHSVGYGNPEYPEIPVTTLAWAESVDDAFAALDRLSRTRAAPLGYPSAAQLECVLADLDSRLTGQEGCPVLVAVGGRSPHPLRVDPVSQIIPCRWATCVPGTREWHSARFMTQVCSTSCGHVLAALSAL